MTQTTTLHEPSFADVASAITATVELPAQTRSHWLCSLRQIAKALDKPMDIIPARWTAARHLIGRLHHARVGANPKTLANHKANVRAALLWYGGETDLPRRGTPLTPEWHRLRERLTDARSRAVLSSLMRHCSARRIEPAVLDETILDAYMTYRGDTTRLPVGDAARRSIVRVWNGCAGTIDGWPEQRLVEPPIKSKSCIAWEEFPEGLRGGVEGYLTYLNQPRRKRNGKRLKPCRPSTIRTRRAELQAAARMTVRLGIDIGKLTSLAALVDPDVSAKILEAYWQQNGEEPKVYTVDLATKFLVIARYTGAFDADALERMEETRASLEDRRPPALTEKNLALIRQVISGKVWSDVLKLVDVLMEEARALRAYAPVKAAVTAQLAVVIAILTLAPVRLGNLIKLKLDETLFKPGGPGTDYMLAIPHYDVKNRVQLQLLLDERVTAIIDEYVHHHRSVLLRGWNEPWLFPGLTGNVKDARTLSSQITDRIQNAIGLRITIHQFRHAAAAIWLRAHPGEYELVRQLLGHTNPETTIRFYTGLECMTATPAFGKLIRQLQSGGDDE